MKTYDKLFKLLIGITMLTIISSSLAGDLAKAKVLYEVGDYFGSLSVLDEDTEEQLYYLWLNEKQIGISADAESYYNPNLRKYYDYVKQHQDLFIHDEAGSNYQTSSLRKNQIKKINPNSIYLAEIRWSGIKNFDEGVWEDGDGSMHIDYLIASYQRFIGDYLNSAHVTEAQSRIDELNALRRKQ